MTPVGHNIQQAAAAVDQDSGAELEVRWLLRPSCTSQMLFFVRMSVSVGEWP